MKTKDKIKIFLVDDDKIFNCALKHLLLNNQIQPNEIMTFHTSEECIYNLRKYKPEIIFLNYNISLSRVGSIDEAIVLKRIKRITPDSEVILLVYKEKIDIAVHNLDNKVSHYITKDKSGLNKIQQLLSNNNNPKINERKTKKHYVEIEILTYIFTFLFFYLLSNVF